jgi:hypothetical protein
LKKYDLIGIISSVLCLVHCLVPSFILLGSQFASGFIDHETFDIVFLIVSTLAVLASRDSKKHIKLLMWTSLVALSASIMMEHMLVMEIISYIAALGLVIAHSLNIRSHFHTQAISA